MHSLNKKKWHKNYPPRMPFEIDLSHYSSFVDMFEESCEKFKDRIAFIGFGKKMTFAELDEKSRAFAAYLQNVLRLKKGDRVALILPNILQFPIALYGTLRAGMIAVCANPRYSATDMKNGLIDSGAETIVMIDSASSVIQQIITETPVKHIIITEEKNQTGLKKFYNKYIKKVSSHVSIKGAILFKKVLKQGAKLTFNKPILLPEDIAFLQYTGGTTGLPKGAILTHKNVMANVIQIITWLKPGLYEREIVITVMPIYHIFSLVVNCLTFTILGGLQILISNPQDLASIVKNIKHVKFTVLTAVVTFLNNLMAYPKSQSIDFSALHLTIAGGMAMKESIAEKWYKLTGCPILNAFGMTEAAGGITFNRVDIKTRSTGIGLPLPSTDISVRDEEGNEVDTNESGELCIKGPQVTQGYWHNSVESMNIFTSDGWLRTGDIAKIDEEGFLHIVDRKKDIIIVSGFKVFPNEVEEIILKHPGVFEVAVVGFPDEHSGASVKAFIVKRDPNLTEEKILAFCHESLTHYKIPKKIEFVTALPKSAAGKILRKFLQNPASK